MYYKQSTSRLYFVYPLLVVLLCCAAVTLRLLGPLRAAPQHARAIVPEHNRSGVELRVPFDVPQVLPNDDSVAQRKRQPLCESEALETRRQTCCHIRWLLNSLLEIDRPEHEGPSRWPALYSTIEYELAKCNASWGLVPSAAVCENSILAKSSKADFDAYDQSGRSLRRGVKRQAASDVCADRESNKWFFNSDPPDLLVFGGAVSPSVLGAGLTLGAELVFDFSTNEVGSFFYAGAQISPLTMVAAVALLSTTAFPVVTVAFSGQLCIGWTGRKNRYATLEQAYSGAFIGYSTGVAVGPFAVGFAQNFAGDKSFKPKSVLTEGLPSFYDGLNGDGCTTTCLYASFGLSTLPVQFPLDLGFSATEYWMHDRLVFTSDADLIEWVNLWTAPLSIGGVNPLALSIARLARWRCQTHWPRDAPLSSVNQRRFPSLIPYKKEDFASLAGQSPWFDNLPELVPIDPMNP